MCILFTHFLVKNTLTVHFLTKKWVDRIWPKQICFNQIWSRSDQISIRSWSASPLSLPKGEEELSKGRGKGDAGLTKKCGGFWLWAKFDIWGGRSLKIFEKFWKIFKIFHFCTYFKLAAQRCCKLFNQKVRAKFDMALKLSQALRSNWTPQRWSRKIWRLCSTRLAPPLRALLTKKYWQKCSIFWPNCARKARYGQKVLVHFLTKKCFVRTN